MSHPKKATLASFIRDLPLFGSFSRNEIDVIATYVVRKNLAVGEVLFHQWEKAEYVCFVEKGALDILKKTTPDQYEVGTTLRRGRSIGEMCIIDNFPWAATARASTNARVVLFPQINFEKIMTTHQDIGINILKGLARLMAQNLRKTSSRLADHMLPLG
jgi:CRP-like cAMP-binding protein